MWHSEASGCRRKSHIRDGRIKSGLVVNVRSASQRRGRPRWYCCGRTAARRRLNPHILCFIQPRDRRQLLEQQTSGAARSMDSYILASNRTPCPVDPTMHSAAIIWQMHADCGRESVTKTERVVLCNVRRCCAKLFSLSLSLSLCPSFSALRFMVHSSFFSLLCPLAAGPNHTLCQKGHNSVTVYNSKYIYVRLSHIIKITYMLTYLKWNLQLTQQYSPWLNKYHFHACQNKFPHAHACVCNSQV